MSVKTVSYTHLTSTSPEGPFIQRERQPIVADEKGIDTSFFIDDDGTPYLYYVRFTGGNVIWVAEMNDDLTSIKKETLTKCISATEPWEKKQGTIAEGPSLLKKGNTYYLIYSANHYESKDYAVGYATASSPKGPWTCLLYTSYVGGSYQDQQGMYKTDKSLKKYNTNANFRKWTYRMNVDIDITKTTLLKVGVSGSLRKQNDPGVGTDAIWTTLMGYNSIMMPITYSDGKVSSWTAKEGNICLLYTSMEELVMSLLVVWIYSQPYLMLSVFDIKKRQEIVYSRI